MATLTASRFIEAMSHVLRKTFAGGTMPSFDAVSFPFTYIRPVVPFICVAKWYHLSRMLVESPNVHREELFAAYVQVAILFWQPFTDPYEECIVTWFVLDSWKWIKWINVCLGFVVFCFFFARLTQSVGVAARANVFHPDCDGIVAAEVRPAWYLPAARQLIGEYGAVRVPEAIAREFRILAGGVDEADHVGHHAPLHRPVVDQTVRLTRQIGSSYSHSIQIS